MNAQVDILCSAVGEYVNMLRSYQIKEENSWINQQISSRIITKSRSDRGFPKPLPFHAARELASIRIAKSLRHRLILSLATFSLPTLQQLQPVNNAQHFWTCCRVKVDHGSHHTVSKFFRHLSNIQNPTFSLIRSLAPHELARIFLVAYIILKPWLSV